MQTNQVGFLPPMGVEGNLFGPSGLDASLYVQLLMVKEYDDQLKDSARQIRIGSKLKQAFRLHKQKVQDLYAKPRDKDGKIELTAAELEFLESKPYFVWNKDANDGQGGVKAINQNGKVYSEKTNYVSSQKSTGPITAANEQFRVWGDPHFNDPDLKGGHFDFQGVPGEWYNYLTDNNLQVYAQHKAAGHGTTVIGQMQVTVTTPGETFDIRAYPNSKVTINGEELPVGGALDLDGQGSVSLNGKTLTVTTPEHTIVATLYGGSIDANFLTTGKGVTADGVAPSGIVGGGFDADREGVILSQDEIGARYRVAGPNQERVQNVKVDKEVIESEMERVDMEIDNLNANSELSSLTLQTLTSQRKLAFETVSNILSKSSEAAMNIARNIGR